LKKPIEENGIYVRCKSSQSDYRDRADAIYSNITFQYFGGSRNDGYFESKYFPYHGKVQQPLYQPPIVAVKIKGIQVSIL